MKTIGLVLILILAANAQTSETLTAKGKLDVANDGVVVRLAYTHQSDRQPAKITWWCDAFPSPAISALVFKEFKWPEGQSYECRYTHTGVFTPRVLTVDDKGVAIRLETIRIKINEPVEVVGVQ